MGENLKLLAERQNEPNKSPVMGSQNNPRSPCFNCANISCVSLNLCEPRYNYTQR